MKLTRRLDRLERISTASDPPYQGGRVVIYDGIQQTAEDAAAPYRAQCRALVLLPDNGRDRRQKGS
jgi:hypothetical protein